MTSKINKEVREIYNTLSQAGFEAYFVGGCVRDLLLEKQVKDWDLATNAEPNEIQKIFPDSFYENQFGTVGVPVEINKIKQIVEVTTYRRESEYKDFRHPEKIEWGKKIEEDLSRRDFTVNAIALRFVQGKPSLTEIVDPHNGQQDLKDELIRTVRDPNKRFLEDALRLMRAIRFSAQLDFRIEENTWNAIKENAKLLAKISRERVRDELFKILESKRAYEGIRLLDEAGLLKKIIPELAKGKEVSQERPGRHHISDVFTHNMLTLKYTPSQDPLVKLAGLIHDIGKPIVEAKDKQDLVIFHNHEVVGAKIASQIADNLRLSRKQKEKLVTLVRWHMFSVDETTTEHAVRKFLRRVGVENVKDMIDLRIGDRLGSGTKNPESWRLKRFKEMIEKELNPPFSINDLAVDGYDVMQELNLKPGPRVGEILQKLFEEIDENLSLNNRAYLLKRIRKMNNS